MSAETLQWLRDNTLIGYRDELGRAWHGEGTDGGANHFTGAVPMEQVELLFDWRADLVPIYVDSGTEHGHIEVPRRRAVQRHDTGDVFQIVSDRYAVHQYHEWLVDQVSALIDVSAGDLGIGSAGLLKAGGQAWVQVRPPATVDIGGDEQLPWILATTAHDGSMATQYKGQRQRVVCDNTLAVGLREGSAEFRVRHVRGNDMRLAEARQALEVIFAAQTEFDDQIEQLMNTSFGEGMFAVTVNDLHPVPEQVVVDGKVTNTRAITNVKNTRAELGRMWHDDPRVAPFKGTVWGAMQAHNTWFHWGRTRGTGGDKDLMKARQIAATIGGETEKYDTLVAASIAHVLQEV